MGKIAAILPNEYLEHLTRKLVEEKAQALEEEILAITNKKISNS